MLLSWFRFNAELIRDQRCYLKNEIVRGLFHPVDDGVFREDQDFFADLIRQNEGRFRLLALYIQFGDELPLVVPVLGCFDFQ